MLTKRKLSCVYLVGFSSDGRGAHRRKPVSSGTKVTGSRYLLQNVVILFAIIMRYDECYVLQICEVFVGRKSCSIVYMIDMQQ